VAVLAVTTSTARADVSYAYVSDVSSFTGNQGATVTVNVYLQETLSKGTSYIASEGGLFAAGWEIRKPTAGSGDAAVSAQSGAIGPGQSFAGGFQTLSGPVVIGTNTVWRVVESGATTPTTSLGTVNGNITKVLLGTATFTVGSQNTTFFLGRKQTAAGGPSGTNTTSGTAQTNLDIDNAGLTITGVDQTAFTIQINVQQATVPEPSSMALCGFAACSMGFGAWRRYKAKKAAETVEPEATV